ncbi:MAG: metallophosphoesterase [Fibrobacterales bacterium]
MADTIRIAQISDIHIGPTDAVSNGVDTREHFHRVMEDVVAIGVDLVVLSGDIALENGEPEAYEWVIEEMSRYPVLYEVMSGNHDKVDILCNAFELKEHIHDGELYFKVDFNKKRMLFLDSTPGTMSSQQLHWVKNHSDNYTGDILVFVHHPIQLADCQFMDSHYALKNRDEVKKAFTPLKNIHHIFTGHYHTEKTIQFNDHQTMYITPSTQIQIKENNAEFEIASTTPGWRLIEWDGKQLSTSVRYVK